ncbi:MAG: hypothetical protein IPI67_41685 [Myxococcales bacterium]|nr:hypothetical protein [Myxococcales bacterium]
MKHVALSLLISSLVVAGCSSDESTAKSSPGDAGSDAFQSGCDNTSAATLRSCVKQDAVEADLKFIAQPRTPGSPHWQAVQDLWTRTFRR